MQAHMPHAHIQTQRRREGGKEKKQLYIEPQDHRTTLQIQNTGGYPSQEQLAVDGVVVEAEGGHDVAVAHAALLLALEVLEQLLAAVHQ